MQCLEHSKCSINDRCYYKLKCCETGSWHDPKQVPLGVNQHIRPWGKCYRRWWNKQGDSLLECFLEEFLPNSRFHPFIFIILHILLLLAFVSNGCSWCFSNNSLTKHLLYTRHRDKPFTCVISVISYINPIN